VLKLNVRACQRPNKLARLIFETKEMLTKLAIREIDKRMSKMVFGLLNRVLMEIRV
jgi:hypothetical protein